MGAQRAGADDAPPGRRPGAGRGRGLHHAVTIEAPPEQVWPWLVQKPEAFRAAVGAFLGQNQRPVNALIGAPGPQRPPVQQGEQDGGPRRSEATVVAPEVIEMTARRHDAVVSRPDAPREIAAGVYLFEVGKGIMRSNVYLVRSRSGWVLVDSGPAGCGQAIEQAAATLFGPGMPPAAILLTHDHPDHAGSTRYLVQTWGCPVYVHRDELRFVTADASDFFAAYEPYSTPAGRWRPPPLDRWVLLPLMRLMPRPHRAILSAGSFKESARALDISGEVPGLPGWECIPTPGHTPGHTAFFRPADRVLIAGDAVVTVDLNSPWGLLLWRLGRGRRKLSGPPWYFTWSRAVAKESMAAVARLRPTVLAPGHGPPVPYNGD